MNWMCSSLDAYRLVSNSDAHSPPALGREGVLHRVAELADRPDGFCPEGAADFNNLVPLAEIISEILSVGPKSKSVNAVIDRLVAASGPELAILQEVPAGDLPVSAERRLPRRLGGCARGEVIKDAGYDGEYGRVRQFRPSELDHAEALFDVPASPPVTRKPAPPATGNEPGHGDNATERHRGGRVPAREAKAAERLAASRTGSSGCCDQVRVRFRPAGAGRERAASATASACSPACSA